MLSMSFPSVAQSAELSETSKEKPDNRWSVGAGILGRSCSDPISGFVGDPCPSGVGLMLQRQMSPQLGVLGQLSADYTATSAENSYFSVALSVGPHWTFNPKSKVQVGAYILFGAKYSEQNSNIWTSSANSSSVSQALQAGTVADTHYELDIRTTTYNLNTEAGLSVDTELSENISVRLAMAILEAHYWVSKNQIEGKTNAFFNGSSEDSGVMASLSMNPSIALRVSF